MSAIAFAAISLLGIVFLQTYDIEEDDISSVNVEDIKPSKHDLVPKRGGDVTGCQLITTFNFHFLFWAYIFCAGLQLTFQTNITAYLKSYNMEKQYSTLFTTLNPIFGVVSKFIAGFMSDMLVHKVPRMAVLFGFNILQTIVLVICIFFSNELSVLVIALVGISMPNGALWCLTPTMLSEFYGMKYFGRNWGMIMFGNAFGGLIMQRVFGWIYDSSIGFTGQTVCHGLHCYTWSFIMMAVLSACSCLFNAAILESELNLYKLTAKERRMGQPAVDK